VSVPGTATVFLVGHVGVGVEGDGRHLVPPLVGVAVQRLDVREDVGGLEVPGRHSALREAVEHERVVAVGAVGDRDLHRVLRESDMIA
jgi:hypothetical protein